MEAFKALEECKSRGLVKSVGVSNYAIEDYTELMASGAGKPVVNQIEVNPFLFRRETIDFFQKEGVVIEGYRALCDGKKFDHEVIVGIAEKYNRSPGQVLGKFCLQGGIVPILKSTRVERMMENCDLDGWEIEEEDMARLKGLTDVANLERFEMLYRKCVNRDTPLDGSLEGVKMKITVK